MYQNRQHHIWRSQCWWQRRYKSILGLLTQVLLMKAPTIKPCPVEIDCTVLLKTGRGLLLISMCVCTDPSWVWCVWWWCVCVCVWGGGGGGGGGDTATDCDHIVTNSDVCHNTRTYQISGHFWHANGSGNLNFGPSHEVKIAPS